MPKKASDPTTGTTPARGGAATRGGTATRGAKRRKTSNNVNSTGVGGPGGPAGANAAGTETYGSGTIIAANPFDDDHHTPISSNTNTPMMAPNANKMMVMSPSQPNTHMHPHQQHNPHLHQGPLPIPQHQQQHPPPPIPPSAQFHHQHRPMNHPHQPHPLHHPQQQHPHQVYSPHQHPQHQNNHYNTMQQPMSLNPHAQMGTPPIIGQHPLGPPPPQAMHPDHLGHHPHQQHTLPTMHNHGHMMPGQHHHQNYGHPPPPPPPTNHHHHHQQQQQTHMIGTSTPPHMMSGPAPSHSPYMTPQTVPPPPPPSHHIEQMPLQQPPYNTNHNVYCGKCRREVYQNEPHIICKAGCKLYFHISCSGLTQLACDLLMKESLAEWACDTCTSGNGQVPFVKYTNVPQLHVQLSQDTIN